MRVGGHRHASAALSPFREPVPLVQEAGLAAGQAWTAAGNLAYTGSRSPDRPARNNNNNNIYLLQLVCNPVAVVISL